MATYVTRTTLLVDKGGKTITIPENAEIKKSDIGNEDVWEGYLASGSVEEVAADAVTSTREAELEAQVAELQKLLEATKAEAEKKPAAPATPTPPAK